MHISIAVPEGWGPLEQLRDEMQSALPQTESGEPVQLQSHEGRAIETAIIVAAITGGATVIAAIIQAVATVASKRKAKTITITGRYGGQVDVPVDAPPEEIGRIARSVELMQDPEFKVD